MDSPDLIRAKEILGEDYKAGKEFAEQRIAALEAELSEARSWKPELERLTRHALAQDRELAECKAYADKLAAGFPDGMLPKDIENMREANWKLAQEIHEVNQANTLLAGRLQTAWKKNRRLKERLAECRAKLAELTKDPPK